MIEKIGINAGKVWVQLDKEGRVNIKALKKTINITYNDLYAAIGWLAREEKLILETEGKEIFVSLC